MKTLLLIFAALFSSLAVLAFLICAAASVLSVACEEPPNENETENPHETHL